MCCMYQSTCLLPAGTFSDMVIATIDMGISILRGGNTDVQAVSRAPCLTFMCCPRVNCLVCFQACLLGGTTYNSVPIVCQVLPCVHCAYFFISHEAKYKHRLFQIWIMWLTDTDHQRVVSRMLNVQAEYWHAMKTIIGCSLPLENLTWCQILLWCCAVWNHPMENNSAEQLFCVFVAHCQLEICID